MKIPYTKQLSIAVALGFAAWVVWLWVDPFEPEMEKKNAAKMLQQIVQQKTALQQPQQLQQPQVYVLPAPPQPSKSIVKAMAKAEPAKPVVKKTKTQPKPKPAVKAKEKPSPKKLAAKKVVKLKPQPVKKVKPIPKPEPQEVVHEVTTTETVGGRALLRVLEHGKGPQIEIAWPSVASQREGLYQKFQSCYGMANAIMDAEGNLFRTEDPRGQRWEINLDRFSGFLRQASGRLPQAEQRVMRSIEQRHGYLDDPVPVRIFPRRVDASLLGGLQAVVGKQYMQARSIQAQYTVDGLVRDIRVDGRLVKGMIRLSQFRRCTGRA